MFVGQASPPAELGVVFVPMVNAGAGLIGIGTRAPPASAAASVPPAGALAESASGRSAGVNAARATLSE
jgi:hypothetical protein